MNKNVLILLIAISSLIFACKVSGKEPAVAGVFYPAEKEQLKNTVTGFLSKAKKSQRDGNIVVLISPHAGYRYSGQVAAYGYKEIEGRDIQTVILLGASHHAGFKGASVYTKGSFKTPLGDVPINEKLAERLINESADVTFYPKAFEKEHSLEVQLPFLQTVAGNFTIVPILISSPTRDTYDHLVSQITGIIDDKTLLVASTDLSHYHDYRTAIEMDSRIISAIERLSLMDAGKQLKSGESEMCGAFPVIIAMEVAKRLGATYGSLFHYANSGDIMDEKDKVVGYASMGLVRSPYTEAEKGELLSIARKAITEHVNNKQTLKVAVSNVKLKSDGAVFVTIKKNSSLRGCIGHIQPVMPLYQSVIHNAVAASSGDPRFPAMTQEELREIDVEVSILSPLDPIKNVKDIQVGKHGLVIRKGSKSGILLPQVATEAGWNRETFLEQICVKAGLPRDSWIDADLYTFTADIIK